jgi:sugar lactone lactonase YvrE
MNHRALNVSVAIETSDILGEGPLWDDQRGGLWWCDLKRSLIHFCTPMDGSGNSRFDISVPGLLGAIALCTDGSLLVAGSAIWHCDPETKILTHAYDLPPGSHPGVRCNDGRVDRQGRLWIGTMDDREEKRLGTEHLLTSAGWSNATRERVGVPNAHCFSPDGSVAYFADSWNRTIEQTALDPVTGDPTEPGRVFATVAEPAGPDGACVDAQGYLWNAEWGGHQVTRYRPDGSVDFSVPLPAPQPTCPVFGGDDYGTLFITTASVGLNAHDANFGSSGSLLMIDTAAMGIYGLPEHRFRW